MDDSELNGAIGNINQLNHTVDGQLSTLLGDHLLTAGAEYRQTQLQHSINLKSGDAKVDQQAVYLQDEWHWRSGLDLTGRLDHHDTYGSEFSPRGYALYNLTERWVVKGGVGKAFKAPIWHSPTRTTVSPRVAVVVSWSGIQI